MCTGEISSNTVPINLFFYYQSEVFDVKGLGQLAFGIGTIAYSWSKIALPFTFLALLKLILFLITASLIMIALQNAAAATCFCAFFSSSTAKVVVSDV